MGYKLTDQQKDEIRRLTQLANRRIESANKQYQKWGGEIVPREVVGNHQVKEEWNSPTRAISRSVKFDTKEDYQNQLRHLRQLNQAPAITEYAKVQRQKVELAVGSATGGQLNEKALRKLDKMNPVQISKFWNSFSDKAVKAGANYSSGDTMESAIREFFGEDFSNLIEE